MRKKWKRRLGEGGWFLAGMIFSVIVAATGLVGCGGNEPSSGLSADEVFRTDGHRIDDNPRQLPCPRPYFMSRSIRSEDELSVADIAKRFTGALILRTVESYAIVAKDSLAEATFHLQARVGGQRQPELKCYSSNVDTVNVRVASRLPGIIHADTGHITQVPPTDAFESIDLSGQILVLSLEFSSSRQAQPSHHRSQTRRSISLTQDDLAHVRTLDDFVVTEGEGTRRFHVGEDGQLRVRIHFGIPGENGLSTYVYTEGAYEGSRRSEASNEASHSEALVSEEPAE